jgi:hypothetical protein
LGFGHACKKCYAQDFLIPNAMTKGMQELVKQVCIGPLARTNIGESQPTFLLSNRIVRIISSWAFPSTPSPRLS